MSLLRITHFTWSLSLLLVGSNLWASAFSHFWWLLLKEKKWERQVCLKIWIDHDVPPINLFRPHAIDPSFCVVSVSQYLPAVHDNRFTPKWSVCKETFPLLLILAIVVFPAVLSHVKRFLTSSKYVKVEKPKRLLSLSVFAAYALSKTASR